MRRDKQRIWALRGYSLCILFLLIFICTTGAMDPPLPAAKTPSRPGPPAAEPLQPAIVTDILRLRQELGNPFQGTLLEETGSAPQTRTTGPVATPKDAGKSFVQALRQVHQQAESTAADTIPAEPATTKSVFFSRWQSNLSPLQQSLRQSWTLLEQRAMELEDLQQYEEADELRKLSRKIRLQSRQLMKKRTASGLQERR